MEKQSDIRDKQKGEKIASLTQIIADEKETRDNWIKRYETE